MIRKQASRCHKTHCDVLRSVLCPSDLPLPRKGGTRHVATSASDDKPSSVFYLSTFKMSLFHTCNFCTIRLNGQKTNKAQSIPSCGARTCTPARRASVVPWRFTIVENGWCILGSSFKQRTEGRTLCSPSPVQNTLTHTYKSHTIMLSLQKTYKA